MLNLEVVLALLAENFNFDHCEAETGRTMKVQLEAC